MKKLLVAIFSGALIAAFSMTSAQAEVIGFGKHFKRPKAGCQTKCHTSCRNYRKVKCAKVLTWRKKCHVHFTTWTKQCKTFAVKRSACKVNKKCFQKCARFINNEKEYTKCYGKIKCRYNKVCRPYWTKHKVCHPVAKKHVVCHKRPTWTRRCWKAKTKGWCVKRCSSICKFRR